jgi:membrane protein
VNISSAALAYFLVFSIFPLIILACGLFNLLHLSGFSLARLRGLVPNDILNMLLYYISYVETNSSMMMTLFGAIFSIYFSYRAVNALILSINTAYGLKDTRSPIIRGLLTLGLTFGLLITMLISLAAITIGGSVTSLILKYLPLPQLSQLTRLWRVLRFLLMAMVSYLTIGIFYLVAPCVHPRIRDTLPGTLSSLTSWVIFSVCFSFYVEHLSTYSLFYGSISIVIVLLLWLYTLATILILGAEINSYLADWKRQKKEKAE